MPASAYNCSIQHYVFIRAIQICGGEGALANQLKVSSEDVARWVCSDELAPIDVYNRAASLVRDVVPKE